MLYALCLITLAPALQSPPVRFAPPVALTVGDAIVGGKLPYPSPRLFDVDGDGERELVLGDLTGRVRVAERTQGEDPFAWGEAKPLVTDGRELKFHNW